MKYLFIIFLGSSLVFQTSIARANDSVEEKTTWFIETIQRFNQNSVGSIQTGEPNTSCPTCLESETDLKYEKCGDNSSRQSNVNTNPMKTENTAQPTISLACVKFSLENVMGRKNHQFLQCDADGNYSKKTRPCISKDYVEQISKNIDIANTCFSKLLNKNKNPAVEKFNRGLLFGLFSQESGLHTNIRSPTGAAGIGQITGGYIKDLNRSIDDKVKSIKVDSPEICKEAYEKIQKNTPLRPKETCDRVRPEKGHPLTSLFYSYAYMGQERDRIQKMIMNSRQLKKYFSLDETQMEQLTTVLAGWMHNTGPAGLRKPLMSLLLNEYSEENPIKDINQFIGRLEVHMLSSPHRANRGRTKETSTYMSKLLQRWKSAEKSVGQKCIL